MMRLAIAVPVLLTISLAPPSLAEQVPISHEVDEYNSASRTAAALATRGEACGISPSENPRVCLIDLYDSLSEVEKTATRRQLNEAAREALALIEIAKIIPGQDSRYDTRDGVSTITDVVFEPTILGYLYKEQAYDAADAIDAFASWQMSLEQRENVIAALKKLICVVKD